MNHEICAAIKGIVAIAVGIAEGMELGCNIKGIVMTEGIHEMATVAAFFDIPQNAAYGIAGAADIIATCISTDSRNVRLGRYLADTNTLEDALNKVGMAVEGVAMAKTIEMLWALDVSIPLIHMVNGIILGRRLGGWVGEISLSFELISVHCWIRAGFPLVFLFCCIVCVVWFCLIIMVGVVCWVLIVDCLFIAECSLRIVRVLLNVFDDLVWNYSV